jgi:ATP-dependent DNA helicase RecQ
MVNSRETSKPHPAGPFLSRGLSVDLEVGRNTRRIDRFAAVRADDGQSFVFTGRNLQSALKNLDRFAAGLDYLVAHNLVEHDAKHLAAADPQLEILKLPYVDTLRLNPLAFPRNPYHHLVKHYQDAALKRVELNDPKLDAELTLRLLRDQYDAFTTLRDTDPDLLAAWHWLTTDDSDAGGLAALFTEIRQSARPTRQAALNAITRRFDAEVCRTTATSCSPASRRTRNTGNTGRSPTRSPGSRSPAATR